MAALGLENNTECINETIHNEVQAEVSKDSYGNLMMQ